MARGLDVPVPICEEVYGVLHEGRTAIQAFRGLRRTSPTSELDGPA